VKESRCWNGTEGDGTLRIIPVVDLMNGLVVRGVAGRRSEYRPLDSPLVGDAQPSTAGRAFAALGLDRLYVADLDAIAGADPAWRVYEELAETGLQLWIDAGTGSPERARAMREFAARSTAVSGIVIGLESLPDAQSLTRVATAVGQGLAVFSLDLKAGQPLAAEGWGAMPAAEIVALAVDCGIERVIVLDLADVGSGRGVGTVELCRRLSAQFPALELVAGGGVRGLADLDLLAAAGCTGALVATALHDGSLGMLGGPRAEK
jgi:phosphoribosylformimino-5-aminoimidazole carboxamide ribotide isomerase